MAKPLLGTTWRVKEDSGNSPFGGNDTLKITAKSGSSVNVAHFNNLTSSTTNYTGTHDSTRDMVTVDVGGEHWELILSKTKTVTENGGPVQKNALYGMSWTNTGPDAMGSWVCDPQN
ncbi:MAG TPA: hypothetical protein VF414_09790 [Thermoanaerobaculia bacterium]